MNPGHDSQGPKSKIVEQSCENVSTPKQAYHQNFIVTHSIKDSYIEFDPQNQKKVTFSDENSVSQNLEGDFERVLYLKRNAVNEQNIPGAEMQDTSDQQLVESFSKGDESAFEEIVLRYRNQVYNTIQNILHDRDLAWDGSQEIFLKIYQKLDTFKAKCPVGAWIYRIALNHGLNMLRKRKKLKEEVPFDEIYIPAKESNDPRDSMVKDEFQNEELSSALDKLPKVQKSVIILRHFSELSFKEISDVLGKTEDSVKSNHYYAIMKLRKRLKRSVS